MNQINLIPNNMNRINNTIEALKRENYEKEATIKLMEEKVGQMNLKYMKEIQDTK